MSVQYTCSRRADRLVEHERRICCTSQPGSLVATPSTGCGSTLTHKSLEFPGTMTVKISAGLLAEFRIVRDFRRLAGCNNFVDARTDRNPVLLTQFQDMRSAMRTHSVILWLVG